MTNEPAGFCRRVLLCFEVAMTPTQQSTKIAGLITAAIWAGFGVWLLVDPGAIARAFAFEDTTAFRGEVRGFYGGIQLGIAAVLGLLVARHQWEATALLASIPLLCIAAFRGVALVVDGFSPLLAGFAAAELTGGIVSGVLALRLMRQPSTDADRQATR